ncbi:hypothetical protein NEMIN01_0311 [Nematocida minor]|uniref:uncharacterized protein n=1 Tax=Nematocida minor TaxID=1912983 RepID=UPI00221ECC02|nr:uncharacterized protein NEMIN01_0311 [Nematocida minor]KAI5189145.1 hypothetical protein NEMIN01_0311 [Nematocida minor]
MVSTVSPAESLEERVMYWNALLKNEEIEEGLEDALMDDLQLVLESPDDEYSLALLDILVHSLPLVECPSVALDAILSLVCLGGSVGVRAFKGLILLHSEYSVNIANIYSLLYDLLTIDLFATESDLLVLLVNDLLYSSSISINVVRSFLKRLSYIAIRVHITTAYKILNVISVISHKHKNSMVKVPKQTASSSNANSSSSSIKSITQLMNNNKNNSNSSNSEFISDNRSISNTGDANADTAGSIDETSNNDSYATHSVNKSDRSTDYYLYELDLLKDHPILSTYIRDIKQNKIVKITEEDINRGVLSMLQ